MQTLNSQSQANNRQSSAYIGVKGHKQGNRGAGKGRTLNRGGAMHKNSDSRETYNWNAILEIRTERGTTWPASPALWNRQESHVCPATRIICVFSDSSKFSGTLLHINTAEPRSRPTWILILCVPWAKVPGVCMHAFWEMVLLETC